ncbi:MAG: glycosyltransferase family 2 protein [Prevotellaceae bacterium]|nr:glycosyltransferase family 2 protein [Candidatus Minthosoma equi]
MVSIIIPIYNVAPYVEQCLQSVMNQTMTEGVECILVDDCGQDNSMELVEGMLTREGYRTYEDGTLTSDKSPLTFLILHHEHNRGLSAARNTGIDVAKGNYITFIDSDDYVGERYVETLYNAIEKSNATISACQHIAFANSEELIADVEPHDSFVLSGKESVADVYARLCRKECNRSFDAGITAWGKLFDIKLFDTIRFPVGKIHEDDAVIPLLLYQAETVCITSEQHYYYRKHETSITNSPFSIRRYDGIEATESCADFFCNNNEKDLQELALLRKKRLMCSFAYMAYKSGLYDSIPVQYKIGMLQFVLYLRDSLHYTWKDIIAFFNPRLYEFYNRFRCMI